MKHVRVQRDKGGGGGGVNGPQRTGQWVGLKVWVGFLNRRGELAYGRGLKKTHLFNDGDGGGGLGMVEPCFLVLNISEHDEIRKNFPRPLEATAICHEAFRDSFKHMWPQSCTCRLLLRSGEEASEGFLTKAWLCVLHPQPWQ